MSGIIIQCLHCGYVEKNTHRFVCPKCNDGISAGMMMPINKRNEQKSEETILNAIRELRDDLNSLRVKVMHLEKKLNKGECL